MRLITPFNNIPCHGMICQKKREPSEATKDEAGARNKDDEAEQNAGSKRLDLAACTRFLKCEKADLQYDSRVSSREPFSSHDSQ